MTDEKSSQDHMAALILTYVNIDIMGMTARVRHLSKHRRFDG